MNRRVKYCPIANQDCLMVDCGLFNEKFGRCEIGLLSYNMYNFAQAIKQFSEIASPESKENLPFENTNETWINPLKDTLRL